MTTWIRPGVRADPAEAKKRREQLGRDRASRARYLEIAHNGWAAGWVRPYLITRYLNLAGLEGPEVDIACGAAEPDVDDWEEGFTYPTWEQLLLLAKLCGVEPWGFIRADITDEPSIVTAASLGSLLWHMPPEVIARTIGQPIIKYWAPAALRARGIEPGAASIPTRPTRS